ncbi:MAG: efflux RND transporter periplasmic adaptor subunit, partial [Bryobacteraceae bacterium]
NFSNVIAPILRGPESGSEMVLLYLAPPGSRVKKGQLIAKIDGQSTQDHVDDIADTIEEAQSDVIKRKAEHGIEWEILQQTLRVAKSEFEKWKLDYGAAEVRTEIEQQLMKLSLDEAEARYKQLQADLASTQASQKAEIRILELTRDRHASHRGRHANDLQKFTIHAPMDGLAVMLSTWRGGEMGQIQQGDSIRPGQGFMKIVSTDDMIVEGTINQAESSLFRIGQEARVHLDAFPGLELKGRVHSIGALAVGGWRQNYYIRNIPLRVRIDGVDSRLIPDLSASADVVHAREENRVLVPLNAVRTEDGKTFAYVKNGESFERREVELGLRNELHAAVLAGLDSGDEVRILD